MDSKCCDECKFWEKTGKEDSGIKSYNDSTKNWFYDIGSCKHEPVIGTSAGENKLASFISCYIFKRSKSINNKQTKRNINN